MTDTEPLRHGRVRGDEVLAMNDDPQLRECRHGQLESYCPMCLRAKLEAAQARIKELETMLALAKGTR